MFFHLRHRASYRYSAPVCLDPQTLRLRPRADGSLRLVSFRSTIVPHPVGLVEQLDAEGNLVAVAWFSGTTDLLEIATEATVETLRANPFDFLITVPTLCRLPATYPAELEAVLAPYARPDGPRGAVADYADGLRREVADDTLAFLSALAADLHRRMRRENRHQGPPFTPEHTLREGGGACRDLAVLFVEACRTQGLAARFVSGYWGSDDANEAIHLHAWAEVYLPGAGWRGFDPSSGLAVADRHLPLAAALEPADTMSVSGSFWGRNAVATPTYQIDLHMSASEPG